MTPRACDTVSHAGGGGEAAIERFYRDAVMLDGPPTSETDHVAVTLPASAAPQQWRTGVYKRVEDHGGRCYARCEKADRDGPKAYLWRVPAKGMWLVGSTPGATTGAAVAYDPAEDPADVEAPWCVFDGKAWVRAAGAVVGAIDLHGATALHHAARKGVAGLVRQLLDAGAAIGLQPGYMGLQPGVHRVTGSCSAQARRWTPRRARRGVRLFSWRRGTASCVHCRHSTTYHMVSQAQHHIPHGQSTHSKYIYSK